MKILAFSDVHRDLKHCEALVEAAAGADIVIGAGDFATARRGLADVIAALSPIRKPFILVPGNSESAEELREACAKFPNMRVLHGAATTLDGVPIFGIGGGIPVTPFGSWSYDFTEKQAGELLASCPNDGILVSHSPPKGAVDMSGSGASIGSTAVLAAIRRCHPRLCICGHVHASAGRKAIVGATLVVNAGPAGVLLDYHRLPKEAG